MPGALAFGHFSRLFASAFVSRDKRRMVRGWRIAGRTLETIRQRPGAVVGEDDKGAKAMKPILLAAALTTAIPTAAAAHCYSIWHYKTPQRCGVRAQSAAIEAPPTAIEAPPTVKPAPEPAAVPPVAPKELLDEDAARAAAIQELREQMRPK